MSSETLFQNVNQSDAADSLVELATRAVSDDGAFSELYARMAPRLELRIAPLVRDRHGAAEVVEDAFLKFRSVWIPSRAQGDASLWAWFKTVAFRQAISYLRRDRHAGVIRIENAPEPASRSRSPLQILIDGDDANTNSRAIAEARRVIGETLREHIACSTRCSVIAGLWFGTISNCHSVVLDRPELLLFAPREMKGIEVAARVGISRSTVTRIKQQAMASAWEGLARLTVTAANRDS